MDVLNEVRNIIANQLNIDVAEVKPETTFEDVKADSLDVVEVIMSIESAFDIQIPDMEVEHLNSVQELSDFITKVKA